MATSDFTPSFSTDEICRGTDRTRCLTDDLDTIEANLDYKANLDHTHTGYATTDDLATLETEVANKAAANHTHTGYATTDHTHDGYFPIDGGTVNGDVNVAGVFRVQGKQTFYYDTDENSQVIGTNNATGGTTVCCGSSATTVMNGANLKAPNILPRGNNTFTLGSTSLRWKGIYSTAAVNVSSDMRMKRDVKVMDEEELAKFIEDLIVVSYNYNWDTADKHPRIGLIAQDVQMANAELSDYFVSEDADGMLGIRPADLVFPLIAAVQKLSERVAELEAK